MASTMTKFGSKAAPLPIVILSTTLWLALGLSSVEAVDFYFYSGKSCTGSARVCYNINPNVCCYIPDNVPSVKVNNLLSGQTVFFYTGGICTTLLGSYKGPLTNTCFYSNYPFTALRWSSNGLVVNGTAVSDKGTALLANVTATPPIEAGTLQDFKAVVLEP